MHKEDSSTPMEGTTSVLELENRRLLEPQKHRKRVSFKDEAWVINIPSCEESHVDLRRSVLLTRNAVANGTLTPSRRPSLETFSSRASLHANNDQRSPQAHSGRIISSGHSTNRGPYKSILKTSTPSHQKKDQLHRSQISARHFRDVSARNSVDGYFKQGSARHLLPSKDSVNRLEKDAFTRPLPAKRSPIIPRALGSDNDFSYSKTGRFVSKEYSASGRPAAVELNYNLYHNKRDDTKNTATQLTGDNFNIVGVTYRSVSEMPYFSHITGLANRINEYSSGTKSTLNGQACLEHSSVPKPLNQFNPSKREERHFSAIPAIEAFNRRNRGARRHFSSTWTSEQVTSPKRQLPLAWQPAKQYNFSTK